MNICQHCKKEIDYLIETSNVSRRLEIFNNDNRIMVRNIEYGKPCNTYWFCPECANVVASNEYAARDFLTESGEKSAPEKKELKK